MTTISDVLNEAIPAGLAAIFNERGLEITHDADCAPGYDAVAVIGFSGEGYGGALGIAAQSILIKTAFDENDNLMSDSWLGEMSNVLLGRLKNALLTYRIEIRMAIPMVLHGIELQVCRGAGHIRQFPIRTKEGYACVWIDSDWNLEQVLELADPEEHAKAEGEMMLF